MSPSVSNISGRDRRRFAFGRRQNAPWTCAAGTEFRQFSHFKAQKHASTYEQGQADCSKSLRGECLTLKRHSEPVIKILRKANGILLGVQIHASAPLHLLPAQSVDLMALNRIASAVVEGAGRTKQGQDAG
jgi:hypothetical protein